MRGERHERRVVSGRVVSDRMDKTIVVEISRLTKDSRYNKIVKRVAKVKAHDEKNECKVGDRVKLMETRPLSKEKHWRVVKILERAAV
ncbi:MAG: 30S ribosomal protein S17 [candidate division NC10 bacterium]|nr:30S ribosomal protein S17 [candidate division NC10 bacterium]